MSPRRPILCFNPFRQAPSYALVDCSSVDTTNRTMHGPNCACVRAQQRADTPSCRQVVILSQPENPKPACGACPSLSLSLSLSLSPVKIDHYWSVNYLFIWFSSRTHNKYIFTKLSHKRAVYKARKTNAKHDTLQDHLSLYYTITSSRFMRRKGLRKKSFGGISSLLLILSRSNNKQAYLMLQSHLAR